MTDSGRELYKQVRANDRLLTIKVGNIDSTLDAAASAAADIFKASAGAIAIVGSGRSSVEEQFLTKKLADAVKATSTHLVSRVAKGDGILISADRNPNIRGALVTGLVQELPSAQLNALGAAIDAGKVKAIVAINEDLAAAGLTPAQLAKVSLVYLGTHANATSAAAKIVIPTLSLFEKHGTFVNQQFRVQKFHKAVPGPAGAADDLVALGKLIAAAGGAAVSSEINGLWSALAAEVPALGTMRFANIPETGLLLDATPWSTLPFVEGETLHYKPASAPAPAAAAKP
jgi:NADH-quinone oxidoreductase subunit G